MGFALTVAIASYSIAQQQQLIGTWLLVSEITEFPDGKRLEGFGGNQKGMLIFDRAGHYSSQLITSGGRPGWRLLFCKQRLMSIAYSKVKSLPTCQCKRRPNTSLSSS